MFACFPYSLAWLTVFLSTSVYHLYFSRLLVGVSHALLTTTVYTVEISSKEMRGTYSLLESVLRCFGCLVIYALGFALRWRQIALFAPIVPITAFCTAVFLAPESPVFLLSKKRLEQLPCYSNKLDPCGQIQNFTLTSNLVLLSLLVQSPAPVRRRKSEAVFRMLTYFGF